MAVLSTLVVKIQGDVASLAESARKAEGILDKVEKGVNGIGASFKRAGEVAAGFLAANVLAGAADKVTSFFGDSIAAQKESIAVGAQLNAVLASTKGVAGLTADEIKDMAGQMEKLSLFEDEAIISSSSLLLTFTKIGKDIFPRAQQSILDMAQAMKMDLQSATTMVGKALNDPIAGITAMSRAGIQFTEDQKKMIKSMVEAGDVAGAQTLILGELETQFGGSAKAASDAAGNAEKYKDRMNDLKEMIGAKLLPIQEKWLGLQATVVGFLVDKVLPTFDAFIKYIAFTWQEGDKLNDWLTHIPEPLQGLAKAVAEVALVVRNDLWPAFQAGLSVVWPLVKDFFNFIIDNKPILVVAIAAVGAAIVLALGPASGAALALAGIITAIGLIKNNWEDLKRTIEGGPIKARVEVFGFDASGGSGSTLDKLLDKILPFRAMGGGASGWTVVGERGPELAKFPSGSHVFSNQQSASMMGGGSPAVVNNWYVSGSILTERDITRIVRDAALRQEFRGVLQSA